MSAVSVRGLSTGHDHAPHANTCPIRSSTGGCSGRCHQSIGCWWPNGKRTCHGVTDDGDRTIQSHNKNRSESRPLIAQNITVRCHRRAIAFIPPSSAQQQQHLSSEPPSSPQPPGGRSGIVRGQCCQHHHQNREHFIENSINCSPHIWPSIRGSRKITQCNLNSHLKTVSSSVSKTDTKSNTKLNQLTIKIKLFHTLANELKKCNTSKRLGGISYLVIRITMHQKFL